MTPSIYIYYSSFDAVVFEFLSRKTHPSINRLLSFYGFNSFHFHLLPIDENVILIDTSYIISLFIDVNECKDNIHNCHLDAACQNSKGSFICVCHRGYVGNGTDCKGRST